MVAPALLLLPRTSSCTLLVIQLVHIQLVHAVYDEPGALSLGGGISSLRPEQLGELLLVAPRLLLALIIGALPLLVLLALLLLGSLGSLAREVRLVLLLLGRAPLLLLAPQHLGSASGLHLLVLVLLRDRHPPDAPLEHHAKVLGGVQLRVVSATHLTSYVCLLERLCRLDACLHAVKPCHDEYRVLYAGAVRDRVAAPADTLQKALWSERVHRTEGQEGTQATRTTGDAPGALAPPCSLRSVRACRVHASLAPVSHLQIRYAAGIHRGDANFADAAHRAPASALRQRCPAAARLGGAGPAGCPHHPRQRGGSQTGGSLPAARCC